MPSLTNAHNELYRRSPDETFETLADLMQHCQNQRIASIDRWHPPQKLLPKVEEGQLILQAHTDGSFLMNDWSFSQLCGIAGVSKDTINRLSLGTASQAFRDTIPSREKPVQLLTTGKLLRSIHGVSYTRLWNTELLHIVQEFATDFQPPQKAMTGGTGLYAGEQDVFAFLIDPTGWTEIGGEAFAPGFFVWNSEVGKRSVGISTFWFQAVCANHIVWDAVGVVEFSRKHTANVRDVLSVIRYKLEHLIAHRDQRRDGFFNVMKKALEQKLGSDADEVLKELSKAGVNRSMAEEALQIAEQKGGFTIFALVDALTRIAGRLKNAGDRIEADRQAAGLLALAQ